MRDESTNTAVNYPVKPITMIVPFGVGGNGDIIARVMEKAVVKHFGHTLVITNIPGGGGTVGWNKLIDAKPDGYTIGITTTGIILQALYGPTKYHYPTSLEPIAQIGVLPIVAAVLADKPWDNINDLVEYANQHPGEIKCGNPGSGMPRHVVAELFAQEAGIDITQVPLNEGAETLANFFDGHVQLLFAMPVEIKEHVKNGKIKVLAVASEKRLTDPEFKNVPTFREQGLDVMLDGWAGIGAPKGLPSDVKNKLAEGFRAIICDPQFQENMHELGVTVEYLDPQEFDAKWIVENARLTKVIKETGVAERIAAQKNSK